MSSKVKNKKIIDDNRTYSNRELIKSFMPYYGKYKKVFFTDLFFASLTTICELGLPLILSNITDTATKNAASLTIDFILKTSLIYVILRIVEIIGFYYMQSIGHIMGASIERDMRKDLFSHLQTLPSSFYSGNKVGSLMSRITSDLFDITEFSHHCPEEFFIASIKFIVSFIILIGVDPLLTLLVFVMVPLVFIFTKKSRRQMRKFQKEQRSHVGDLNAGIEDSLLGSEVIKSFANEEIEEKKFEVGNEKFVDIKKKFYYSMANFHSISRVFDGIMFTLIILFGGLSLIKGRISPGQFVAYILFIQTLLNTIRRIVEFSEQFEKGMTGIERFNEIMSVKSDIVDKPDAIEIERIKGNIDFKNVDFKYPGYDEYVIKNLNLTVKAGDNIAIVGPSGGGKTTISKLIPRFYDVSSGSIEIDGIDVRDIKLANLRENIGIVQQEVYLFSGNIYENIEYGKPGADKDEIIRAAKLAGAYDFIMDLPYGFDTYVGERGVKLSGGQKQRISIARVFLKNPPVLILDEATSALDNKSENIVQTSLNALSRGRTTITIAHRLSTIIGADKIIVLTEDGIVEEGSHGDLLELKGEYYNLYSVIENKEEAGLK